MYIYIHVCIHRHTCHVDSDNVVVIGSKVVAIGRKVVIIGSKVVAIETRRKRNLEISALEIPLFSCGML